MSDIKKCFLSRWGTMGWIIEADFSQLEVIALAFLSQDKQLYDDILSGRDMHCYNAADLFDIPIGQFTSRYFMGDPEYVKMRKIAKAFSFQLQYGAGAKSMAEKNGVDIHVAKKFIENYYKRYPQVGAWQHQVYNEVAKSRVPSKRRTKKGLPAGMGTYRSITGRQYAFFEYDNDYARPGEPLTRFAKTETNNYPVQGFATGDVVPLVLGRLYHSIQKDKLLKNNLLMINTVHDSVLFDFYDPRNIDLHDACTVIKNVMENAPKYIEETFDIPFDLPLKVEVKASRNWGDTISVC